MDAFIFGAAFLFSFTPVWLNYTLVSQNCAFLNACVEYKEKCKLRIKWELGITNTNKREEEARKI